MNRLAGGDHGLYDRPIWSPILQTTVIVSTYILLGWVVTSDLPVFFKTPCWVFMSFILTGCLGGAHDCAHGTMFSNRFVNRVFGNFWASMGLINYSLYRAYHGGHHKFMGLDTDPEPTGTFRNIWEYLRYMPAIGFFVEMWTTSLAAIRGKTPPYILSLKTLVQIQTDNVILAGWIAFALWATVVNPSFMIAAYWIPITIYFPMMFFTGMPEHYGCSNTPEKLVYARTITSNPIFRYFYWNGNFHSEHHVFPDVPSCNLPALNQRIGNAFKFRESSYLKFHWKVIRSLWSDTHSTKV